MLLLQCSIVSPEFAAVRDEMDIRFAVAVQFPIAIVSRQTLEIDENAMLGESRCVSDDQSEIYDPITRRYIPMPTEHMKKREALRKVFLHFSKTLCFFTGAINVSFVHEHWIPQRLWTDHFDDDDTNILIGQINQGVMDEIFTLLGPIMREWRSDNRWLVAASTREQLERIRSYPARAERIRWFESMLIDQTVRTDHWILEILGNFTLLSLIKIFAPPAPDIPINPFRNRIVHTIASWAEVYFERYSIATAERRIAGVDGERSASS